MNLSTVFRFKRKERKHLAGVYIPCVVNSPRVIWNRLPRACRSNTTPSRRSSAFAPAMTEKICV